MGKIILYYKYVQIDNPEAIVHEHKVFCTQRNLTGRVLIAQEGINGTLAGSDSAIQEYKDFMNNHPLFGNIDFKENPGDINLFPKLKVLLRTTIVNLGVAPELLTVKDTGKHLTPQQVNELIERNKNNPDFVILDTRNDYESAIGTFKNAIIPDIKTFREFPEYIDSHLDSFKDKEVLMFCTGGIRCERATAYLNVKDVAKTVYQIEGGIHRYAEQYPDGYFRGKNYVFDGRIATPVNNDILGHCLLCQKPCDDYNNCINTTCNKHFIGCDSCLEQLEYTCSPECLELVRTQQVPRRAVLRPIISHEQNNQHTNAANSARCNAK